MTGKANFKKNEKSEIDVNLKLPIIRSVEGSLFKDHLHFVAPSKKILNIPIGDVLPETDYDTNVSPTFIIPTSYVRYTKKMGDEIDVSVDYFMEDEDLLWLRNNTRISLDRDAATYLGVETFEKIITLLEKHTGYMTELIPLIHAEKLIGEKLKWPPTIASKVVPEVYTYWVKKREKYGHRPLCRKYWPATSSTDTNPHHTFRTRDKERYRLRKQHRKNDVEAFRKMQQLRRDFGKARELLQLVLERESLREALFLTKKQFFQTRVLAISLDLANSGISIDGDKDKALIDVLGLRSELEVDIKNSHNSDSVQNDITTTGDNLVANNNSNDANNLNTNKTTMTDGNVPKYLENPVDKYKLLFPNLLDTPVVPKTPIVPDISALAASFSTATSGGNTANVKANKSGGLSRSGTHKIKNRDPSSSSTSSHADTTTAAGLLDAPKSSESISETVQSALSEDKEKPRTGVTAEKRNDKKQKRKLSASTPVVTFATTEIDPVTGQRTVTTSTTAAPAAPPVSYFPPFTYLPGMPGPPKLCRPMFPSFMVDSECREQIHYVQSFVEYLKETELQVPFSTPLGGIPGISCQSRQLGQIMDPPLNSANSTYSAFQTMSDEISQGNSYPKSFRVRGRIGRGGRYVIDRIPLYSIPPSTIARGKDPKSISTTTTPAPSATSKQSSAFSKSSASTAAATVSVSTNKVNNKKILFGCGGYRMMTKFLYAAMTTPYDKPHKGTGSELMGLTVDTHSPSNTNYSQTFNSSSSRNTEDDDIESSATTPKGTSKSGKLSSTNMSFPVAMPMSQGALPLALKQREQAIYNCSDSEDEMPDYVRTKKPKVADPKAEIWRDSVSKYYVAV